MEERHWWLASKIQESFHIGGYDNPTLLEDFMCDAQNLGLINQFLGAKGPCRLLFFCNKPQSGVLSTRELRVTHNPASLRDLNLDDSTVLYFIRHDTTRSVDPNHIEKDVFCGEIKMSTMETLTSMLSNVLIPLVKSQKDWGDCSKENQQQFVNNLEKYQSVLGDSAASLQSQRQIILKHPEHVVGSDYKQHRIAAQDPVITHEYEELVVEWMSTIEGILTPDNTQDRLIDLTSGPLLELDKWRRRQRQIVSVADELKSKECKAVISVLVTAKSKLVKRWKTVDTAITDALNEARDKVKYLESLKRHLDLFYNEATPWSVMTSALPGLITALKQMDSISRYFARNGFLGYLFQKLTNQLVVVCKNHLRSAVSTDTDDVITEENFWRMIDEEIENRDLKEFGDLQCKQFKSFLDTRLNKKRTPGSDTHRDKEPTRPVEKGFYDRLKSCIVLLGHYRDCVRSLSDVVGLGAASHYGSLTSVNNSAPPTTTNINNTSPPTAVSGAPPSAATPGVQAPPTIVSPPTPAPLSTSPSKTPGTRSKSLFVPPGKRMLESVGGVAITDDEAITEHLDTFCRRLHHVMDVITTLAQYKNVLDNVGTVPRPRQEDLVYQETEEEIRQKKRAEHEAKKLAQQQHQQEHLETASSNTPAPVLHQVSEQGNLVPIAESQVPAEDEVDDEPTPETPSESRSPTNEEQTTSAGSDGNVNGEVKAEDVYSQIVMQHGITKQDVELLNTYYHGDDPDEGPSVHSVVSDHVRQIHKLLVEQINLRLLLDVETKNKAVFEDVYDEFMEVISRLEQFLCAYIHAVFMRRMKTHEALNLLTRFLPVQHREGMKNVIEEKFVDIFNGYEDDIIQVQRLYERYKDCPPRTRNSPRVGGAIAWVRQLLHRVEYPMRVFRESRAVTTVADYSRIVRVYNRLAATLVQFENLWFSQLKTNIEQAKTGLRSTLLVRHPQSRDIVVNCDDRVLAVIQEVKWLVRLGIQVPDSAHTILAQEERFKQYKDHLNLCLREFHVVIDMIPECFLSMYTVHIDNVEQQLQPGLGTLAWNSMNIDSFLHQVYMSVSKLRHLVESVNHVISSRIEATIDKMADMSYIDETKLFSRTWPPEEFKEEIASCVKLKNLELKQHLQCIESAMHEAAALLNSRTLTTLATSASEKKTRTKPGHRHSSVSSVEDQMVLQFIEYYSESIYRAVLMLTCRSLVTLAESSGCDSDVIRQLTNALSNSASLDDGASPVSRAVSRMSRATSAKSDMKRPVSVLSILSNMSWSAKTEFEPTLLRFEIGVQFRIPDLILSPALKSVQSAINDAAASIINVIKGVHWFGGAFNGDHFHRQLLEDEVITDLRHQLAGVIGELEPAVQTHLMHFSLYEFLWKDDLKGNYMEFIEADPGAFVLSREVERLLRIERNVLEIPSSLPVGPVVLKTDPIKNSLHGFAIVWKNQYSSLLHEEAKKKLDTAILYRTNVRNRLELAVTNLDQLNSTLHLLEELRDMENKIDAVYLPIENMYDRLKEFDLRLRREEVEEVDHLRDKWQELMLLADSVSTVLLREKRGAFEQELDKQVKTFVVEVIQFRNAFDAQGPAVPGIEPQEAVQRLLMFTQKYHLYEQKRKTLDSVSRLFGIACKPFPELDRTGEELELLGLLYGLYQKFIRFDQQFRDTLWADVDLESASREVESFWDGCLALPSKLKDWDAYHRMRSEIQEYMDVLPLLQKLASKDVEIRNRHWLQVMQVTGSSFQLEANVFKLMHLLDIGLLRHKEEIEDICYCAAKELELEIKLRLTEEEWTEQVLVFEPYKRYGPIYLDKSNSERLIEQLEDAEALLANMLTSRFIGPMREEAASWAEKLKEVGEVLELWLEVQDLWQFLEAVFSNHTTAKELPQEAKRFQRIDKGWIKMMKRAYDTKNVLQCCHGGEVPKANVLRHILEELEVCFKSLSTYLDGKRRAFPRFYFVSDPILLAMLSKPNELESIKPYLRAIFTAICDVELTPIETSEPERKSRERARSRQSSLVSQMDQSQLRRSTKIDKRLTQLHNVPASLHTHISVLPSDELEEVYTTWQAVGVASIDGEQISLQQPVTLENGVEVWLKQLQLSVSQTLQTMLCDVISDVSGGVPLEDLPLKYPTQICRFGLLLYWTREAEIAMMELRYDRKAIQNASKKWTTNMQRLPQALSKAAYRGANSQMYRVRLEHLITYSIYLRDSIDLMAQRKLKEPTDFDWKRNFRCYANKNEETGVVKPVLALVDGQFEYGNEFYGAQPIVAMTPSTDRCHLTMAQAVLQGGGACVGGETGSGKTETVKGFGHMLGHHITVFECTPQLDCVALGRMLTGLAVDGCWGFFDNLHNCQTEAMAVLLDYSQTIFSALRAKQQYCHLSDGHEISLSRGVTLFVAYDPRQFELPDDVKALFRQVCLSRPDPGELLKLKCASMGFRAPNVLATRLKIVCDLTRDQLPSCYATSFSTSALHGVLLCGLNHKRALRDEKSDKPGRDEASRSTSQLSGGAQPVQPAQRRRKVPAGDKTPRGGNTGGTMFTKKAAPAQPLTPAVRLEHALVGRALVDIMGPKMGSEGSAVFNQIVKDVFQALPEPPSRLRSASTRHHDLSDTLIKTAKDRGLVPTKPWISKCQQLYDVSKVNPGVIIAGPPGSGKSSVVQTLVEALSAANKAQVSAHQTGGLRANKDEGLGEGNHRLQKVNPLVVDDLALMFGYLQNKDWVDGIVTSSWRKANRNQCTTWLCFDGVIHPGWTDKFNTVLDTSRILYLDNGDHLYLSDNMKILFETDDLSSASPSTVARSGIVFVDKNVVGWKPVAQAWMDSRTQQEKHVLQRAFDKTVDSVASFVLNETRPKVALSEVGMFQTCIHLLSAMLSDNKEIGGKQHIERLYLFCLIWAYGGVLEGNDRKNFSEHVKTLSSALPDDDRDVCVFDYYVDESGEWDPWSSRVPEAVYADNQDVLGDIFVETVQTMQARILMEFAVASNQNVLLVGASGTGKTCLINDFIHSLDNQKVVNKKLVLSAGSRAGHLQHFIESNIYHRQGFVFGAKENKKLQIFIDDLSMPGADQYGIQSNTEFLRQLVDDRALCTLQKPFEWRVIEGLRLVTSMTLHHSSTVSNKHITQRLLRHFAVFNLPTASEDNLRKIVYGVLETNLSQNEGSSLDVDLHAALTSASCRLLAECQNVLKFSSLSGRQHYLFSLKDIVTCFRCLRRLPDESRADEGAVISLWRHEMNRILLDRLSRHSDIKWYNNTLDRIIQQSFTEKTSSTLQNHFVTFPVDAVVYQRTTAGQGHAKMKIALQPVETLLSVRPTVQLHLDRYNEEYSQHPLEVTLSDLVISHVVRLHRILSFHHSGNALLLGSVGSHLATLCELALHIADIPRLNIDSSKQNTFFDGLRSALRLAGSEGKKQAVVFTAYDLHDPLYLDAINSILISGEYPHLFTNDEMDGLLQAVTPALKRERPALLGEPMKFFVSRVKSNLHVLLCLPPDHQLVKTAISKYPGLLNGCQLLWMADWPMDALLGEAKYFLEFNKLQLQPPELSESVTACMADIHSMILTETKQIAWAGDCRDEIQIQAIKSSEKKQKSTMVKVENFPYSRSMIQEHIKQLHRVPGVSAKNEVFIGPLTYRRFMAKFLHLYLQKSAQRTDKVAKLEKVLSALAQTRTDAKVIRQAIKTISAKYNDAKTKTTDLMKQLTSKATQLEKLKAQTGMSTALGAFFQLNDVSDDSDEEEDGLLNEEYDEYDEEFDKMRAANLMSRQARAREELETAKQTVITCRRDLDSARQQVISWRGRVDRACIERIKAFSQPPMLVVHVIEMILCLVGKRIPGMTSSADHRDGKDNASAGRDDVSAVNSASSSTYRGTKKSASTKFDSSARVDRAQWKAYTKLMEDPVKFVNMLHNVQWEDGLDSSTVRAVESYLARGTDGTLGVTGEGSALDNTADNSQIKPSRRTPSPDNTRGITIAAARFSNEDAAILVQYTIAIVEFSRLCGPLKQALDKQAELEREIEESERLQREAEQETKEEAEAEPDVAADEEELNAEDLERIQGEVLELQREFDDSVVEKHSLETELLAMRERLKAASDMIDSLKQQESTWTRYVEENNCNEVLLTNCLSAAAYLTYCGGFDTDVRRRLGDYFIQSCEKHSVKGSSTVLFRDIPLTQYMYSQLDIKRTELAGLPCTQLVLEHSCFINQSLGGTAWPLVCDSTNYSIDWLKRNLKATETEYQYIMAVKYKDLKSQLETSLAEGHIIIITDIDLEAMSRDDRFKALFRQRHKFLNGKHPFKMMVADHEVECQPRFRMYLHTSNDPQTVPQFMAAYVNCVRFQLSRSDLEEMMLDRFMVQEKTRLSDELAVLNTEWLENMTSLEENEDQMLMCLSGDVRLMNDLSATKRLADLKKQYDEANESLSRVNSGIESIMRARQGFRHIARRGAVCFDVSQYLREINPLYQTCIQQYLDVYDNAIAHSDRASVKAVIERLTFSVFVTAVRALLDRDRLMYTMLLALEIEDSQGRVGPGEREFLLSPQYGATVMQNLKVHVEQRIQQAKKPFDWMQDDQFQNLQILASYWEWFQEMFDRMPKDGRETQWRALCESEQSESVPLPDRMDETYTPLQRLLVIRSVRPDRVMQLSTHFIHSTLGKRFSSDVGYDLTFMVKQSTSRTPLLVLHTGEAQSVLNMFTELVTKKIPTNHQIMYMANVGSGKDKIIRRALHKAMEQGHWLLLHSLHNCPMYLDHVDSLLTDTSVKVDPQFRLWLSVDSGARIPPDLLQNCLKIVVDTPKTVKGTLYRAFSSLDVEQMRQERTDLPCLLHNISYLHAAVRLRARFGGWLDPTPLENISQGQLEAAVRCCMTEIQTAAADSNSGGGRTVPWNAIRYQIAEVLFGGAVTNTHDLTCLSAMVDFWLSPASIKRDFELSKVKYKLPLMMFNPNAKQSQYIQTLDNMSVHQLEVPEACHLHSNPDTALGEDQYVFTRINKVYDCMPTSDTLTHTLFNRPPTPYDGPPQHSVSNLSTQPSAATDRGVVASASYAVMKSRKDAELYDVCSSLLPRVPKTMSAETLNDRLAKIGGNTTFNQFVRRELEMLIRLLSEIRATLQAVRSASEMSVLGDQLSAEHMEAADALYASRIPAHWRHLAADTAPPAQYSLANWLLELAQRWQHLDKLLTLGKEKMPAYWLGAFFNPRALLALFKQDWYRHHAALDKTGNLEPLIFRTEITARDKDHLRDPPPEGVFIFGIYLKGAVYDKAGSELQDAPNKAETRTQLPVILLTCVPQHERFHGIDQAKQTEVYACPVYSSRNTSHQSVLDIDLRHDGIQASRWALRGLHATLRPW